jgi:glycogen(starch) synthase
MESVWRSTRLPDELLVVDDGSRGPATREVLAGLEREAADRGLPLRVMRQENRGLAGARNAGLEAVRSEFVSFLDGDDLIDPTFYELALDLLRRDEGLGGVAAWSDMFGEGVPPGFWNAPQAEFPLLLVENTVFVPCMLRTAVLRDLGGYDAGQRYNYEDWELSVRLLASGRPIVTIPRYLQRYRVRGDSLLRTMSAVQNQGMRERLLAKHRATVSRFGVEVAMLLEGELMRRVYGKPRPAAAGEPSGPVRELLRSRTGVAVRATRAALRRWRQARPGGAGAVQ